MTMEQRDFQQDIAVVNIPYYSQNLTAQNIFHQTALPEGFCIKKSTLQKHMKLYWRTQQKINANLQKKLGVNGERPNVIS
jgi:hypothetical protein